MVVAYALNYFIQYSTFTLKAKQQKLVPANTFRRHVATALIQAGSMLHTTCFVGLGRTLLFTENNECLLGRMSYVYLVFHFK